MIKNYICDNNYTTDTPQKHNNYKKIAKMTRKEQELFKNYQQLSRITRNDQVYLILVIQNSFIYQWYWSLLDNVEEINTELEETDIVLVIGANDIVNIDAEENKESELYGLPVLKV